MLERIKAQIGEPGGLRVPMNREDPAVVMQLVVGGREAWEELGSRAQNTFSASQSGRRSDWLFSCPPC
jgi:hypothetical protein